MKHLAAAFLAWAIAWPLAVSAAERPRPLDAFEEVRQMGRGVNVLGSDPVWRDPAVGRFQPRLFKTIRKGGFRTVRMNLQAFAHMDAGGSLDPVWLATLDRMVKAALDAGLFVIIDEHDYHLCAEDTDACQDKLTAFWRQIGAHYAEQPASVMFEILNEPNGKLDDEAWNRLLSIELAEIRKTNPERNVVVGPAFWNNLGHLDALQLPEDDRHLIATVHYYEPMSFTHQGASWVAQYTGLSGIHWGSPSELERLDRDFDQAQGWARAHRRPVLLGEFGAYDKADMESRVRYTAAVARAAEARGWAWAYWQFDSDFVVYDMKRDAWVAPIHQALVSRP
jgi:endoglucanase